MMTDDSVRLAGCSDVKDSLAELVEEARGGSSPLPRDKRAGLRIHLRHCAHCTEALATASGETKTLEPQPTLSDPGGPEADGAEPQGGEREGPGDAFGTSRAARIDREADALRARIGSTDADLATFFERMMSVMRREAHFAGVDMAHGDSTTEMVSKGVLKLMSKRALQWTDEAHFRRSFRTTLRHLIISEIRAEKAEKRGGGAHHTSIDGEQPKPLRGSDGETRCLELLAIDEAVERLSAAEPNAYAVFVEHHIVGRTQSETAEVLQLSLDQVKKLWSAAKWFIAEQLTEEESLSTGFRSEPAESARGGRTT